LNGMIGDFFAAEGMATVEAASPFIAPPKP
jgi:hypothetical protein